MRPTRSGRSAEAGVAVGGRLAGFSFILEPRRLRGPGPPKQRGKPSPNPHRSISNLLVKVRETLGPQPRKPARRRSQTSSRGLGLGTPASCRQSSERWIDSPQGKRDESANRPARRRRSQWSQQLRAARNPHRHLLYRTVSPFNFRSYWLRVPSGTGFGLRFFAVAIHAARTMRRSIKTGLQLALAVLGWDLATNVVTAEDKPIHPDLLRRFEARTYRGSDGALLNYRLYKPAGQPPATNLPLVLFLHGAAGLGDDNQRQFNGGNEVPPLALTADEAQARFPSFIFAPQCPRGESWSEAGREPARMIRLTLSALERLKTEFRLDSTRFYLVGVSMGGVGAWDVAAKMPAKFAAVVPICGSGNTETAARLTALPIWCFHGADDPLISVERARQMIGAIRKAGGQPRYTEYPGVGHDSYRNAFREPELLPWMFRQSTPAPTPSVRPAPTDGAGRR